MTSCHCQALDRSEVIVQLFIILVDSLGGDKRSSPDTAGSICQQSVRQNPQYNKSCQYKSHIASNILLPILASYKLREISQIKKLLAPNYELWSLKLNYKWDMGQHSVIADSKIFGACSDAPIWLILWMVPNESA